MSHRKEGLANLSLEQLGKIEVTTVSKEPEEVRRTPAAIYVLTQNEIRRSGVTTVPEALRLVPGVQVARIDSDHWAIGIRGFTSAFSKSLLVMIDGRSVYSPLFAGVYWDVQNLMLEDIDRIEVIRGPGGTIWGPNAVNGVINIITKKASQTHGLLATTTAGGLDHTDDAVRWGSGNGKGFDYRVYGKGFARGHERVPDPLYSDAWHHAQAGFRADWDNGGPNTFTIEGDAYRGRDGYTVAIATINPPAQNTVNGTDNVGGGNLLFHWQHTINEGSDVQVRAYFDRTTRMGPQTGQERNTFDFDFLHHITLRGHQNFLWGLGARISPTDFIQRVPTVDFLPHHFTHKLYTGFVQDTIPLHGENLTLTVGSKFGHNVYTGFEVQPSARLMWTPTERQSFWAAVTRAVRTPARLDRDLSITGYITGTTNPPIFVQVLGNPDFFSERLIGYEAGYRNQVSRNIYIDVAAYRNSYNFLSSIGAPSVSFPTTPIPRLLLSFPYVNGVKGVTDGVEISPNWRPRKWWRLRGSYSYLHMNLENRPGFPNNGTPITDQGSSPAHQIEIQSMINLPRNFEFDQTYRYVSKLPAFPVSAYQTADVRFGWSPGLHWAFSLGGRNLLQPYHQEWVAETGPPVFIRRTAYGKVDYRW